jgi:hypothetical protein
VLQRVFRFGGVVATQAVDRLRADKLRAMAGGTTIRTSLPRGLRIAWGLFVVWALAAGVAHAATYYISPTGNDSSAGTEAQPWATFNRAWNTVARGDTLVLLDGVYYQTLTPRLPAPDGRYITVRAKNEGLAVLDGQGVRSPVDIVDYLESSYLILEGLVARNGTDTVYSIRQDHIILRRCSGHDANLDGNSTVFLVWATDVVIEDCIGGGTGRKMFMAFVSQRVTFRRNLAMPTRWDGRRWCGMWWPYTAGFEFYQTSDSVMENNVGYARADAFHFYLASQADPVTNDRFVGNMAIYASRDPNGTLHQKPQQGTRPTGGDNCTWVMDWDDQPSVRAGYHIYPGGTLDNHLFQDNLAYGGGSIALGFSCAGCHPFTNSTLRRMTAFGNGLNGSTKVGGPSAHADMDRLDLDMFAVVQDNKIERVYNNGNMSAQTGTGARLRYRYVDAVYKDASDGQAAQPLWPWPMEQRAQTELGISVTNLLAGIVPDQVNPVTPPPPVPPSPPTNLRILP